MHLDIKEYEMSDEVEQMIAGFSPEKRKHIGTHIDVYQHSKIDLPAKIDTLVIDVRGIKQIGLEMLQGIEIVKDSFVIFHTGVIESYPYGSVEYFKPPVRPYLTNELVDALLDRKVKLIGIDASGIQHGEDHVKIDKHVENYGAYVIENICNLDKVETSFESRLTWNQENSQLSSAIGVSIEAIKKATP